MTENIFSLVFAASQLFCDATAPRLTNEMPTDGLAEFQKTVEQQADLPNGVILSSPTNFPLVALTFDDGPDRNQTPEILEILNEKKVPATFFFLGNRIEQFGEITREIRDSGHALAGHSFSHPDLRELEPAGAWTDEIEKTSEILRDVAGVESEFFRPPYGAVTDEQLDFFGERGMRAVNWSVDSFDWDRRRNSPKKIVNRVREHAHAGAIILLHSGGGDRSRTVAALPDLIDGLREDGFEFATIPQILNAGKTTRFLREAVCR